MTRQARRGGVKKLKAAVGFEPTSHGFANQCLSPLGHAALRIADYIHKWDIFKDKAEKNKNWPRAYGLVAGMLPIIDKIMVLLKGGFVTIITCL